VDASVYSGERETPGWDEIEAAAPPTPRACIGRKLRSSAPGRLHRFRESGPDDGQLAALLNIHVNEYAVVERPG
jgi:hypothetical protein